MSRRVTYGGDPMPPLTFTPVVSSVYEQMDDDDPVAWVADGTVELTEHGQRQGWTVQDGRLLGPENHSQVAWLGRPGHGRIAARVEPGNTPEQSE